MCIISLNPSFTISKTHMTLVFSPSIFKEYNVIHVNTHEGLVNSSELTMFEQMNGQVMKVLSVPIPFHCL